MGEESTVEGDNFDSGVTVSSSIAWTFSVLSTLTGVEEFDLCISSSLIFLPDLSGVSEREDAGLGSGVVFRAER